MIQRQTQGNPIAAGVVAFGLGLLVATLIPASEPERQAAEALQDTLEPLKDRALEAGQELKDQVQEAARDGVQHVKETATDAAQQVKDDTQSAGERVKEDAQEKVQHARGNGPTA
jgi:gas vesicle protein